MTITGQSSLSKDEIDRMVRDADAHAEEDRRRREEAEIRNNADSLAYQVEKTVNESRDILPVGVLSNVDAAIADVRAAINGDNLAAITKATDTLQRASHAIAEQLYKAAQGAEGSRRSQGSQGSDGSNGKDAEIVDAEYAETK